MRLNYDGSNQNGEQGSGSDWFNDVKNVGNTNNQSSSSFGDDFSYRHKNSNAHQSDTRKEGNISSGYANSVQTSNIGDGINTSSENIDVDRVFLHNKLVKAYMDLESELAIANQGEFCKQEEIARGQNFNDNFNNSTEDRLSDEKQTQVQEDIKKSLSSGAIVGIVVGIIAFLAVVGIILFIVFGDAFKDKADDLTNKLPTVSSSSVSSKSIQALKDKIDTLYSDSSKTGIKDGYTVSDLDALRSDLESYSDSKDYDKLVSELDTIELYLNDINVLKTYQDLNYNIEPESVASDCEDIKSGLSDYSVSGLKSTISGVISSILSDRNTYLSLKEELGGIEDVSTFNYDLYIEKAKGVKHTPNKNELITMCDDLLAEKNNSKDKDESNDDKEDKDSEDKKSDDKKEDTSEEKPTTPPTEPPVKPTEKKTEKPTEVETEGTTDEPNLLNAIEDLVTADTE